MLFKSAAVASLIAGAAALMPCLAPPLTEEDMARFEAIAEMEANSTISSFADAASRATIYVDTYVHVVASSQDVSDGYLSRDTIEKQMDVLNADFSSAGFQYVLKDIDWTVNSNWAYDNDEMGMKRKLRRGPYSALNLYFITDIGNGNTGHCYYPTNAPEGSTYFTRDGCVMSSWTTPGGGSRFSLGRITTHEVGHWSGLIHTFEGNDCNGYGDYVDDTPSQSGPSSGCPTGRDSCPSPGLDPIHNHMDYTDDSCRTEFTPQQIQRMTSMWNTYRS